MFVRCFYSAIIFVLFANLAWAQQIESRMDDSPLPPGAMLVAGDPTKNEFFIVGQGGLDPMMIEKKEPIIAVTKPVKLEAKVDTNKKEPIITISKPMKREAKVAIHKKEPVVAMTRPMKRETKVAINKKIIKKPPTQRMKANLAKYTPVFKIKAYIPDSKTQVSKTKSYKSKVIVIMKDNKRLNQSALNSKLKSKLSISRIKQSLKKVITKKQLTNAPAIKTKPASRVVVLNKVSSPMKLKPTHKKIGVSQ